MREMQPIPYPNVPTPEQMEETSQQTRPYRVGYGATGLVGVDRELLKQKVRKEAPARSEIEDRGDTIGYGTVKKGEPWWKRLGAGVLTGLANADPDNPNDILGKALGGGVVSASGNQNAAQLKRAIEIRKADNDIDRGLRLAQEEGQLANIRLKPQLEREEFETKTRLEMEKIEIERQKNAGLITEKEAERRERELDRKERERHNRATEGNAGFTLPPGGARYDLNGNLVVERDNPALGIKEAEAQTKRAAKLNESSALYKKADALDAEAKKLEGQSDPFGDLAKRIADYNSEARKLRADGDKARSEGEAIPVASAAPKVVRPASDGKYHYTHAQIKAQAEAANKSYEDILAKLKSRSDVVIDE